MHGIVIYYFVLFFNSTDYEESVTQGNNKPHLAHLKNKGSSLSLACDAYETFSLFSAVI